MYYRPGKPKPYLVRVGRGDRGRAFGPEEYERAFVHTEDVRRLRAQGVRPARARRTAERTLNDAIDELLARKRVTGTKAPLTDRGYADWEQKMRFWQQQPFVSWPLSQLDVATVEDAVLERAAKTPTSAREELQKLKAVLRYAAGRGSVFPLGLLEIEPIRVPPSEKGVALAWEELDFYCGYAPEHQRLVQPLLGTIGLRIGETLSLTDEHVDLDGLALRIPAALCKERRPKTVPLFPDEVLLLEEQLASRAPGATRVFPRKGGTPWRPTHFAEKVVNVTRRRAAVAWRRDHDLPADADTPFEWTVVRDGRPVVAGITPHDFRRTAATLMRDAGFTKEQAATRLGHGDDGTLLNDVYDKGDRVRRVRAVMADFDSLRDALDQAGTAPRRAGEHADLTSRPGRAGHLRAVR
jgi:integrase